MNHAVEGYRERRELRRRAKYNVDAKQEIAAWITVNGQHIPLDEDGNAVGGYFKGIDFSKANIKEITKSKRESEKLSFRMDTGYEESKHPRGKNGQFASKGSPSTHSVSKLDGGFMHLFSQPGAPKYTKDEAQKVIKTYTRKMDKFSDKGMLFAQLVMAQDLSDKSETFEYGGSHGMYRNAISPVLYKRHPEFKDYRDIDTYIGKIFQELVKDGYIDQIHAPSYAPRLSGEHGYTYKQHGEYKISEKGKKIAHKYRVMPDSIEKVNKECGIRE